MQVFRFDSLYFYLTINLKYNFIDFLFFVFCFFLHATGYLLITILDLVIGVVFRERGPAVCRATTTGGNPPLHTGSFPAESSDGCIGAAGLPLAFQYQGLRPSLWSGNACCHRLFQCSQRTRQPKALNELYEYSTKTPYLFIYIYIYSVCLLEDPTSVRIMDVLN